MAPGGLQAGVSSSRKKMFDGSSVSKAARNATGQLHGSNNIVYSSGLCSRNGTEALWHLKLPVSTLLPNASR